MNEPEINTTSSAELIVADSDLASALAPSAKDSFPPVFATSRMVALMELASARSLGRFDAINSHYFVTNHPPGVFS